MRNHAWSPTALRINGWRYSGPHEAPVVRRTAAGAAACAEWCGNAGENEFLPFFDAVLYFILGKKSAPCEQYFGGIALKSNTSTSCAMKIIETFDTFRVLETHRFSLLPKDDTLGLCTNCTRWTFILFSEVGR